MDITHLKQQVIHLLDKMLHPSFIIPAQKLELIIKAHLWHYIQANHFYTIEDMKRAWEHGRDQAFSKIRQDLTTPFLKPEQCVQQLRQKMLSMEDFEKMIVSVQSATYEVPQKNTGPIQPVQPAPSLPARERAKRKAVGMQQTRMEIPALHPYHLKPASPIKGEVEMWTQYTQDDFQADAFVRDQHVPRKQA